MTGPLSSRPMGQKPSGRDEPVSLDGIDPEDALRALLQVDPHAEPIEDPEAWAREHVHLIFRKVGHTGVGYTAQVKVDGLVFEGRAEGQTKQVRKIEARAVDEAVAAYLDFIERSKP